MPVRYSKPGTEVDFTAGVGGVQAGIPFTIYGSLVGICQNDVAEGEKGSARIAGEFRVPNPDGTAFALGVEVQYDAAEDKAVTTGGLALGPAHQPAEAGDPYVGCLLNDRES